MPPLAARQAARRSPPSVRARASRCARPRGRQSLSDAVAVTQIVCAAASHGTRSAPALRVCAAASHGTRGTTCVPTHPIPLQRYIGRPRIHADSGAPIELGGTQEVPRGDEVPLVYLRPVHSVDLPGDPRRPPGARVPPWYLVVCVPQERVWVEPFEPGSERAAITGRDPDPRLSRRPRTRSAPGRAARCR